MLPALFAVGAITSLTGALSGWISGAQRSKEQKAQALQLKDNMERIREMYIGDPDRGIAPTVQADYDKAMALIDSNMSQITGSLKGAMEQQLAITTQNIQGQLQSAIDAETFKLERYKANLTDEQERARKAYLEQLQGYRRSIQEQVRGVQSALTQRRLGPESEVTQAMLGRAQEQQVATEKQMGEKRSEEEQQFAKSLQQAQETSSFAMGQAAAEAARQEAAARGQMIGALAGAQAQLGTQALGMQQGLLGEQRQFKFQGMQDIMQLGNMATSLEAAAGAGPWGDIFKGLSSGAGLMGASMFYTPTGASIFASPGAETTINKALLG